MRALGRLVIIMMFLMEVTLSYDKKHPPCSFKDEAPKHIKAELLVDYKRIEYPSQAGQPT